MESAKTTMLYNAALEKDWKTFDKHWEAFKKKYLEEDSLCRDVENLMELCFPVSIHGDNIFHLAVYSRSEKHLDQIINLFLMKRSRDDSVHERSRDDSIHERSPDDSVHERSPDNGIVRGLMEMSVNKYGNTVLHEAAIRGNLEAARLLVGHYRLNNLLEKQNDAEETPLFVAAANGNTKIVKYLASLGDQTVTSDDGEKQLKDIHRKNKDGVSVLLVAVQGQHFGTAIELLKLDEGLANLVNKKNQTGLYMLAKIPSAVRSKNQIGVWKKLVFSCLPARDTEDYNDDADKIEIKGFYPKVWNFIIRDYPIAKNIWKEKRNHEFAGELARTLIKKDTSWEDTFVQSALFGRRYLVKEEEQGNQLFPGNVEEFPQQLEQLNLMIRNILHVAAKEEPENPLFAAIVKIILGKNPKQLEQLNHKILLHVAAKEQEEESEIPLFAAIRAGNAELVKCILEVCPQQLERLNRKGQNILHMAAMYRQKEVFNLVKSKEIATMRMARQIDKDGYTVLHSVADTKHYKGGTSSGPAYQLQKELEWFSDVKEIIPSSYTTREDYNNKTAEEILKEKHAEQLKNAQTWIKDTSQSCSGVAVLVATVVFAAAFTVPGGNNESNGLPVLLHSPVFLFFTTMDVIALSCSLTSVVMFLSVLTSPFELENFRASLPRRLTFGFALLFVAVAATMIAFSSTIFLIIRLDQSHRWTLTFICCAAFFPVSVLALTHFPLFVSFIFAWKKLLAFACGLLIPKSLRDTIHQGVKKLRTSGP